MKCQYEKIILSVVPDRQKVAGLYEKFPFFFLGDSGKNQNPLPPEYSEKDWIAAGGLRSIRQGDNVLKTLITETEQKAPWLFGYFSYEWKNQLEDLQSNNRRIIESEPADFFEASFVLEVKKQVATLWYNSLEINPEKFDDLINEVEEIKETPSEIKVHALCRQDEYLKKFESIRKHLQNGDSYEITFCRAWEGSFQNLSVPAQFLKMQE